MSEQAVKTQAPNPVNSLPASMVGQSAEDDRIKCPKCGSLQIHIDKKGRSGGKGCCGWLACGPLGFLFATRDANKLRKTCLKCNHSWE